MSHGKTTVIEGKVYYGGGLTGNHGHDDYIVYCYDPSQDNWTTLPPLPVKLFGLGQVNGQLVAVAGLKKSDSEVTNEVYTYDERSRKWKQTIPPMPTARHSASILSLQSALVVACGEYADAEEIFKTDTSQWYRNNAFSTPCYDIAPDVIGNTCYAIGACSNWQPPQYRNALYVASVDDLLRNTVPANQLQTTHSSSTYTPSAWKELSNTPVYCNHPDLAVLAGNLLAIGGDESSLNLGIVDKKEVYMFSPSTNSWVYICDLPEPRSDSAVAVLSSTEILVIGGRCDYNAVSTTYKGTLQLKL